MSEYQTNFQNECLAIMRKNTAGQIILPTGSGKSRIEFEFAKEIMVAENDIHEIVIIVAPRIILCQQLLTEFYKHSLQKYGSNSNQSFTFVSSGNIPDIEIGKVKYVGKDIGLHTTNSAAIEQRLDQARSVSKDSIIFSTYASFERCMSGIQKYAQKYDRKSFKVCLLADEAHHFAIGDDDGCSKDAAFKVLKANLGLFDLRFFFTATPKVRGLKTDDHSGMDNEKIYGKRIFEKSPQELIQNAVICMPVIQFVIPENPITGEQFRSFAGDTILQGFKEHQELINKNCGVADLKGKLGAKVLVVVDSGEQFRTLKRGMAKKAKDLGITLAGTMADTPNHQNQTFIADKDGNVKPHSMDDFLDEIRKLGADDTQKLLILHYNQLTEGIDIPAMTGLMPLRYLEQKNIVQNLGRISRVHPTDNGKSFKDLGSWLKPYAYVILPQIDGMNDEFADLMGEIRGDYNPNIRIIHYESAVGEITEKKDALGMKVVPCGLIQETEDIAAALAEVMNGKRVDLDFLKVSNGTSSQ